MASPGVTKQLAVPVLSVIPVQVSLPLSMKVTGSLAIGVRVFEFVSTPDTDVATLYSPVAGLTATEVGMAGGAATLTVEESLVGR